MSKKVTRKRKNKEELLTVALENNIEAIKEGPKQKSWSLHNLKTIKPLNFPQKTMFESFYTGNNIIADGSRGTGKTFASIYLALSVILSKEYNQNKLIIVRSAVPSRNVGHLPGTLEEKMSPYEVPYRDIVGELMQNYNAYDSMKDLHKIIFMPTSYVRGLTWDNAVILIDEVQNLSFRELNSVITRTGSSSKLIVSGDYMQNDLVTNKYDQSCMAKFLSIVKYMKSFDHIKFSKDDILRSDFVKEWICAMEESENIGS